MQEGVRGGGERLQITSQVPNAVQSGPNLLIERRRTTPAKGSVAKITQYVDIWYGLDRAGHNFELVDTSLGSTSPRIVLMIDR